MASSSASASNPNPWGAPYDTYKDCSQGICSIYCPQWCYIIFPPPPPFDDDSAATDFSPLIIAVIGIIASAFILVSYYTIISKYCRRRRHGDGDTASAVEFHDNQSVNNEAWRGGNNGGGLDEGLIKSITVYKYKKGEGLVEESDCSVCLSEFLEDESLRLLPKCNHAFHLPCIDTWLKSHSNCPLCRANIIAQTPPPPDHPPPPGQETAVARPETGVVSVNQYQHRNDETVLVIHEEIVGEQAVLNDGDDEIVHNSTTSDDQVGVEVLPIRRSVSLNSYSVCRGPVLVADILRSNEEEENDDDDYQMEKNRSKRVMNLVMNSPLSLKRSISTGRFMFTRFGKSSSVNDSIIPN